MSTKQLFAYRLRVAMSVKGVRQFGLSELLPVSSHTVGKWTRAEAMPEAARLPELAQVLGVSIDWLLGRSDDNGPKI